MLFIVNIANNFSQICLTKNLIVYGYLVITTLYYSCFCVGEFQSPLYDENVTYMIYPSLMSVLSCKLHIFLSRLFRVQCHQFLVSKLILIDQPHQFEGGM